MVYFPEISHNVEGLCDEIHGVIILNHAEGADQEGGDIWWSVRSGKISVVNVGVVILSGGGGVSDYLSTFIFKPEFPGMTLSWRVNTPLDCSMMG